MAEETKEKKIMEELDLLLAQREKAKLSRREFYNKAIDALVKEVKALDKSIPGILNKVFKKLEAPKEKKVKVKAARVPAKAVKIPTPTKPTPKLAKRITTAKGIMTIKKGDRKRFLEDIKVESDALKKLRKTLKISKEDKKRKKPVGVAYKKISLFAALSSKIFSPLSLRIAKQHFVGLQRNLRRANIPYLPSLYISIMLLSVLIAFFVGIIGSVVVTSLSSPPNFLVALAKNMLYSLLLPVIVFFIFSIYPSSQAASIKSKIENELPFAAMHMATISGAGVEPSKIFMIIAVGEEYPYLGMEAKKIINQINFYGYDLVTAVKETARTTPSERLADLLNGMATTITSGGDLHTYFEENSASLLHDYKLKRERYVAVSGTYADVYTGMLIAAPLIFMLMLTLVNVIGVEMSTLNLGVIGIGAIIALNIGFLIFLQISQPPA